MATITTGSVVLMDAYDFSSYFQSVEFKADVDVKDSSTLATTGARSYQPGLVERGVSGEGFLASGAASTSLDTKFDNSFSSTANKLITIGNAGATQGYQAIMMNTKQANFNITNKIGDLLMAKFEAKATLDTGYASFALGKWLMGGQTITTATNGTSYDNSASSTGYLIHCHITDTVGLDTLAVKVQHSTNNSTWVDLAALSDESTLAVQSSNTATTVNRYLRVIIGSMGATTSVKVWVAIKTGYTG